MKTTKAEWVAALRSGEYAQGTGLLRDFDNRFCCLGVLCDLEYGRDAWVAGFGDGRYAINGSIALLHGELLNKVGKWSMYDLTNMNDSGSTFAEIADWIEANMGHLP